MPSQLNEILEGLNLTGSERDRIARALELMNLQAAGSEKYREDVQVWTKDDRSPVTVADLLHQSQFQHMIRDHFPGDGLVAEESPAMQEQTLAEATEASERYYGRPLRAEVVELPEYGEEVTWMIDPIDGTKGYLAGRYYAIAVGFFRGGTPVFGAMAVPHAPRANPTRIDNALAFAIAGQGAWIGTITGSGVPAFEKLETQREGFQRPYRVAVSLEHGGGVEKLMQGGEIEVVKLDSQAKYLAVAANEIDAYMRKTRGDGGTDVTWDHMPGVLIATESGASVCMFDGSAAVMRPERVVRFAGGVYCHRGPVGGPIGKLIQEIAAASR